MNHDAGHAFSVQGLVKSYPSFRLGPFDLDLEPGAVLAFIGRNGAGKTTTLNCMVGLCRPDAGRIEIFGSPNDPDRTEWKHQVGYVGEPKGFYQSWSAARNLRFLSGFYPRWDSERVAALSTRFELPLEKRVDALSGGNRAKLALVAALAHRPGLLLLDEPFSGLDPVVRSEVLDVLWEALADGSTAIMYSTHILSDISRLADDFVFIDEGRRTLRTTKEHLSDSWRRISFRAGSSTVEIPASYDHQVVGNEHRLVSWDHERSLPAIREAQAESLQSTRMSVDEIAVEIMKGKADVATAGR